MSGSTRSREAPESQVEGGNEFSGRHGLKCEFPIEIHEDELGNGRFQEAG